MYLVFVFIDSITGCEEKFLLQVCDIGSDWCQFFLYEFHVFIHLCEEFVETFLLYLRHLVEHLIKSIFHYFFVRDDWFAHQLCQNHLSWLFNYFDKLASLVLFTEFEYYILKHHRCKFALLMVFVFGNKSWVLCRYNFHNHKGKFLCAFSFILV